MSFLKNGKRLSAISVFLCAVMLFSALTPICSFAEEGEETSQIQDTSEGNPEPQDEETSEPVNEETSEPVTEETTEPVTEIKEEKVSEKKETKVKGIKTDLNLSLSQKAVMKVTVKPATGGRKVVLQRYNSKLGKYVTVKKYKTKDAKKAKLKIEIPKKYRRKTTGYWRIAVKESDSAEKYVSPCITVTTMNLASLKTNADCVCIYDVESGNVIYGKNLHRAHKQASTTKIMTAVLLIESGKLDGTTKVSKSVANTPYANVPLKAGETYRNRDLLYSLMLPSSNESASAIATGVSSTQKQFVKKMNKKARTLGFENTRFSNPHGLDTKKNHTTVYDLARLNAYASQYNDYLKVIGTSRYSFGPISGKYHHTVVTTDKIKSYSKRHLGGKTGFTSGAGYCFSSVYKYKGRLYTVSVLGCDSVAKRWRDMKKLYNYINKYAKQKY